MGLMVSLLFLFIPEGNKVKCCVCRIACISQIYCRLLQLSNTLRLYSSEQWVKRPCLHGQLTNARRVKYHAARLIAHQPAAWYLTVHKL